ncbi:MAG: lysophospholipid acyltransferase family protein [Candidatus Polarisedimenticolia bacterium]
MTLVQAARASFYWTIKGLAWPVTRTYSRLRVRGLEHVPRRGACIIVANHTSYADAVVLGSACPRRISFLITAPIYRLNRLRWFYYMMGAISVSPDAADPGALKAALRTLREGRVVGIFPEGQRMGDARLGSGKAGVSLLASRGKVPVIPAAIIGAHEAMPIGSVVPRPRPIRVVFGRPLEFPATDGNRPSREQLNAFANQVMRAIAALMPGNGEVPAGDGIRSAP